MKTARPLTADAEPGGDGEVRGQAVLPWPSRASIMHHHVGGLVCDAKQGKFVVYSLSPHVFRPRGPGDVADTLDLGCCRQ